MLRVCLLLDSIVQYVERNLVLLVTWGSDLPLGTIKYCSVVFGLTLRLVVLHFVVVCRHQQSPLLTVAARIVHSTR